MSSIKISIITVCLNNKEGLKKTIESVIGQTYTNKEFIIIDGQSTDGSVDLIKSYDTQIDYWISEKDQGIYDAMNKGIDKATGEYLLFLNSGDWLCNEKTLFEIFSQDFFEDIIYGDIKRLLKDGSEKLWKPSKKLTKLSFCFCPLTHQCCFIKRDLFKKYGKYDLAYRIAGDYEGWFRFIYIHKASYKYVNNCISVFQSFDGLSSSPKYRRLLNCEFNKIKKQYYPYYLRLLCKIFSQIEYGLSKFPKLYNTISKIYRKVNSLFFKKIGILIVLIIYKSYW